MIQQLIVNGIITGSIYALIAIGFIVIYRTVKFFNFAHGVVYTSGAYITYTMIKVLGTEKLISWIVAILMGVVGAGILGVLIDRLVYYPLRQRNASNLIFLLASFGVFIFIQNLIQLIYGAQILTIRTGPIKEGYYFFGAVVTKVQLIILIVSLFLSIALFCFLKYTKLGKAMRAVSDDTLAASVVGINPEKIIVTSFAIGSALAGVAGILVSFETNIEPTMGFDAILKGIIASIIGGVNSIPGAVIGGFFLGLVENLSIWKIPAGWKDAIAFAVLILFLLLRPSGFFGDEKDRLNLDK